MALFCAAIRKDSISLLRFPFLRHVQVFSCEVPLVCRLKYLYSCFASHFCFLIIFAQLILVLSVLLLVAEIRLPLRFFILSCNRCIDSSTLSWIFASPLPPFLDTYSLSTSSQRCKYYPYYLVTRALHISVSRWFLTGVWVTASLLKSPGLFLVFWPFSTMLSFGWSPLVHQLPSPLAPLAIL